MNSKAHPPEQDPFATRHAARLVTYWCQSLEQDGSGAELRHAKAMQVLRQVMPVAEDPQTDMAVAMQGVRERIRGVHQTRYHLDEVNAPKATALIGVSRPPSNHHYATKDMEALHAARMVDTMVRLQELGWPVHPDKTKRPKGVSGSSNRRIIHYMRIGMPTENGAESIQALIADMKPVERATLGSLFIVMPDHGPSAFTPELLANPYDPSRLIDNKIAANVIAQRIQR